MKKTKKPKRIKTWMNAYEWGFGIIPTSAKEAKAYAADYPRYAVKRVAVPLIEIRRGEVVVDVEALVREFEMLERDPNSYTVSNLRAALKKVGTR